MRHMHFTISKNNIAIRLTHERWSHIINDHDELIGRVKDVLLTVKDPDIIVKGALGELIAAKQQNKNWVVVVYKEFEKIDGFIITSFITSRIAYLLNKKVIWKKSF